MIDIDKLKRLHKTGSVKDIKDALPDLVCLYADIEIQSAIAERNYEMARLKKYIELKKQKKA